MTLSHDRTSLARLNKEIADLRTKEAAEGRKIADAERKMLAARASAAKAKSESSRSPYLSTADREERAMTSARSNQSKCSDRIAEKTAAMVRLQTKIATDEDRERKAVKARGLKREKDEQARRRTEDAARKRSEKSTQELTTTLKRRVRELEEQLSARIASTPVFKPVPPPGEREAFDVFISHASEDKADFVDEFARKAKEAGLRSGTIASHCSGAIACGRRSTRG